MTISRRLPLHRIAGALRSRLGRLLVTGNTEGDVVETRVEVDQITGDLTRVGTINGTRVDGLHVRVEAATYTVPANVAVVEVDYAGEVTITLPATATYECQTLTIRDASYACNQSKQIKVICGGSDTMNEGVGTFRHITRNGGWLRLQPDVTDSRWIIVGEGHGQGPSVANGELTPRNSGTALSLTGLWQLALVGYNARNSGRNTYGTNFYYDTSAVSGNYAYVRTTASGQWETGGFARARISTNDLTNIRIGLYVSDGTEATHAATDTPAEAYAALTFSTARGDSYWTMTTDRSTAAPEVQASTHAPVVDVPDTLEIEWFSGHAIGRVYDKTGVLVFEHEMTTKEPPDGNRTRILLLCETLTTSARRLRMFGGRTENYQ